MKKRGQVTVFIIIGILILLSVVAFISIKSWMANQQAKVEEERAQESALIGESIKAYTESCIRQTTEDAIFENSLSGGYFILPEKSTNDLYYNVPYYIQNAEDISPSDDTIAIELAKYIDTLLDLCTNDFQVFEEKGFEINSDKPTSDVTLLNNKAIIKTTMPISLKKGTITKEISSFNVEIPVEFYPSVLTARKIIETSRNSDLCISCFSNLALENDLFLEIMPMSENRYVIVITDNNYVRGEENYQLRFAVQYE